MIDSNVIAAIVSAGLGALSIYYSTRKTTSQQQKNTEVTAHQSAEAALVEERIDMRRGYQERYDSLTLEIKTLSEMLRDTRSSLVNYDKMHQEDLVKIATLERRNADLSRRTRRRDTSRNDGSGNGC